MRGVRLTVAEIAKLQNVTPCCIYNRLHKGYAVDGNIRKGVAPKVHKVGNRSMTANEIANTFGISIATAYNRIRMCGGKRMTISMFVKF